MIVRRVGPKGQVVIPSNIREMLEIKPGEEVVVEVRDGTVLIKPKKESVTKHLSNLVLEEEKRVIRKIVLDKYYEEELADRQRAKG